VDSNAREHPDPLPEQQLTGGDGRHGADPALRGACMVSRADEAQLPS
jgi:hypothetical protein